MSGIFDKYLNMINGSKHTHGQMNTKTNTGVQHFQSNAREKYIPYQKPRKSSAASMESEGGSRNGSMASQGGLEGMDPSTNPFQNPGVVTDQQVKKVLSEPNNRVNF